jgi:hypothetical protein
VNTEITNAVKAADDKAQYDERAKRLLSQKHILAHMLVKTVDEFRKELGSMCNLSQGIVEDTERETTERFKEA